jgi:hypothetical protein
MNALCRTCIQVAAICGNPFLHLTRTICGIKNLHLRILACVKNCAENYTVQCTIEVALNFEVRVLFCLPTPSPPPQPNELNCIHICRHSFMHICVCVKYMEFDMQSIIVGSKNAFRTNLHTMRCT